MDQLILKREDSIASISFNRPEALNAFTPELLRRLSETVKTLDEDDTIAAIILQGEGRAFSAGVDLKVLQAAMPVAGKVSSAFDAAAHETAALVRGARAPIIAKVHGFCFTGALELALHCDFIMTTAGTKFGDTHAKWGLRPSWGMSQNLARAVGVRRARELSFTARTFTGAEAVAWGLANAALPDKDALDDAVTAQASAIAKASRGAIAAYKKLYRIHEESQALEDALDAELRAEFPEITDTAERLKGFG